MANTTASKKTQSKRTRAPLAPTDDVSDLDMRSRRARTERMAVTALGGGVYEVESESGHVYSVDLLGSRCTCPDHNFRGTRCKHLRRVAIEVTEGRVPPPGKEAVACVNCGDELFVEETDAGPHLCEECTLKPGDAVVDRETGDLLVVAETTGRRADEVEITGRDATVAAYPTNEGYREDDVVVEAMYPIPAGLDPDELQPRHLRRYSFPRGRLVRRGEPRSGDEREDQSELSDFPVAK